MKTNLFIESVEPGAVVLTDAPRYMEGRRALLGVGDVGCLLRVLSECRSEMKSLDGDFEIRRAGSYSKFCKGEDDPYDYRGRICGEEFGLSLAFAHVLKCALERAGLDISRTRT